ncbi:MAG: NADP-dependent malic enzyme [Proteobacteria bacterium]|nr:NADP-dependent malic enzyme [Pseudomonadota bacterium]
MSEDLRQAALDYHRYPKPGKLGIHPTKPMAGQRDLALAYSPGVADACNEIVRDPAEVYNMTVRANLVAVITNGTAVLGLGPIGALASKPVMEGKAVLFKNFAGIDVFDIEIDELDPDKFVDTVARLEPTFGAINLEDIKAPECFEIETKLKERMNIPVFHDDQHGTAICVNAAIFNALRVVGKKPDEVTVVCSGAGAAALACLGLLVDLGIPQDNITVCDRSGVVYKGREDEMDPYKARFARDTKLRTLAEAIEGADIFLGLSGPGVLKPEMVKTMADAPMILALANPTPEILPELAREARPDAIIATGRSDYPNQVNNVLCFPFIFRGALDVGASEINSAMKLACVKAIADVAMAETSDVVARAYGGQELTFGAEYILPKPFDPRLIVEVSSAVAQAAMDSGVATRPIDDMKAYRERLAGYVYRTGHVMKTVFAQAQDDPKRLVYAEGEEWRVLQAVQIVCDEGYAEPILVGRKAVVERRIKKLGLRLERDRDFELCDPDDDPRYREYWELYHGLMERNGVTRAKARTVVRTENAVIAALMLRRGEADAMLAGPVGTYRDNLKHVLDIVGLREGIRSAAALQMLVLAKGVYFMADTNVTYDPSAEEIAEMTVLAAEEVRRFGIEPKVALLSHSNFGSTDEPSALKMREALELIQGMAPDLEVEGEMHGDVALNEALRDDLFPSSRLKGAANLLIMPELDSANIAFNLVKQLASGLSVGPMLVGMAKPAHILNSTVTVRGTVNMSALAVIDAQTYGAREPVRAAAGGD